MPTHHSSQQASQFRAAESRGLLPHAAFVTALLMALLGGLVAQPRAWAETSSEVRTALAEANLTESEFRQKARALGTPSELIEDALHDVEALRFVPVNESHERTGSPEPIGRKGTIGDLLSAACDTASFSVTYENALRQDLARYTLNKQWCFSGNTVTSGDGWAQGWVAAWAIPWSYEGEVSSNERFSGTFAHVSWSQGKFNVCARFCGGRTPVIEIVGYGDGTSRGFGQQ